MTQYMLSPGAMAWLDQLFGAKAARGGAVIRRKRADVDRIVGQAPFIAEMRRRGYAVIENAGQYVIFCNREPVRRLA